MGPCGPHVQLMDDLFIQGFRFQGARDRLEGFPTNPFLLPLEKEPPQPRVRASRQSPCLALHLHMGLTKLIQEELVRFGQGVANEAVGC